jgi:hypothetical protein
MQLKPPPKTDWFEIVGAIITFLLLVKVLLMLFRVIQM